MKQQESAGYESRTVFKWVADAAAGYVSPSDFQRSFVWDANKATAYIDALLRGRPVGLFMILKRSEEPQFAPREFNNFDSSIDGVVEFVLDGQQRLTSLLHALYGHPDRRFFIKVEDLTSEELTIEGVVCESKNPQTRKTAKNLDDPATAFTQNLIPIDVLQKTTPTKGNYTPLADWCLKVGSEIEEIGADQARWLEDRIVAFIDQCLFQRNLWCCVLPESTDRVEATEIFIAINTSSVRIRTFDSEVARVRGTSKENLRNKIQDAFDKNSIFQYYFPDEPDDYIPEIGEWMMKIACLHIDSPPKESRFKSAVDYLLETDGRRGTKKQELLNSVIEDMKWSLRRAQEFGVFIDKMLPSWPVLHVLAALRSDYQAISDPAEKNDARRLLKSYYWKSLFSNRYEIHANDRLHQDYKKLSNLMIENDDDETEYKIFDEEDHPLFDGQYLLNHSGWISNSRLGRALLTAVMAKEPTPIDWMTGEELNAAEIRELQGKRSLHRHHIFPQQLLKDKSIERARINSGLNAILADKSTNLRLWKNSPTNYVKNMLEELDEDEDEIIDRISSHMVPYDQLISNRGSIAQRYNRFLKARSELLEDLINKLADL